MKKNTIHFAKAMLTVCLALLTSLPATAQSWAKKAAGAVFTLKTFAADGTLLGSSNGFFISDDGQAVSSFAPFRNAQRAVVIDAQGKEWAVECLLGANDMYDVAKFQVATKKATALTMAAQTATVGSTAWLLPYAAKKAPAGIQGTVEASEQFQEQYPYYTLSMAANDQHVGCPVLNDNGEAIGILQPSAGGQSAKSFAVGCRFARDLHISGMSINDPVLNATTIAKALPDNYDDALLSLFMSGSVMNQQQYDDYIERFIAKFPNAADGYVYRARTAMAKGDFAAADADMQQALKVAEKKDDAHYQYAQMMYQKAAYQADKPYEPWSLDRALQESQQAYTLNPLPVYRQQQAQILFLQQKYDEAYQIFMELTKGELRNADTYYAAAQCKMQQGDRDASIALLDSAVNMFTKPYVKTAAPYLLARAQALYDAGKYRPSVNDYNEYEQLMAAQLNAGFYFLREQAELQGHLFQQALNDINKAIEMDASEPVYLAEKASLLVRVGMHSEAIETAQQLIRLSPDSSDGYLFLGLAQCLNKQKAEGLKNLTKAKELGHAQAQSLIDKYGK